MVANMESLKVVIIEDEEAHFHLMKRAIENAFSCASVVYFEEPGPCLEMLDEINPDVIIVDYVMPGMNGIEFLEALNRENGGIIPVIMITGHGDENIAVQAMKLGAWDYLIKTPEFSALLPNVIDKVVRERELKESLRESEQRYRVLFNSMNDAMFVHHPTPEGVPGKFIEVNDIACQRYGYAREAFLKLSPLDISSPERVHNIAARVKKLFAEKHITFETEQVAKDGRRIPVEISSHLFGLNGQPTVLSAVRDVTNRKRAEQHIRTLTQQVMKAQETERQKISRDLHDHVAQDLLTMKIGLDTLFDDHPEPPPGIGQRVSELSKMLQRTINAVRYLAHGLHPASLDRLGLSQTTLQHCEEFSARAGVKVDFLSAGIDDLQLDFDTKIVLYRLVQEALNNVKKHADATDVTIRLVASFPNIILRIEDNGKGFDVNDRLISSLKEKRMGLWGMKERVGLLKGKMTIESRPMQGTKILIEVPCKEKNSGQKENHPAC
jgi:PAS domain S-box-containing protein